MSCARRTRNGEASKASEGVGEGQWGEAMGPGVEARWWGGGLARGGAMGRGIEVEGCGGLVEQVVDRGGGLDE